MRSEWADEVLRVRAVLSSLEAVCTESAAAVPDAARRAAQLLEDWLDTRVSGDLVGVWALVQSAQAELTPALLS